MVDRWAEKIGIRCRKIAHEMNGVHIGATDRLGVGVGGSTRRSEVDNRLGPSDTVNRLTER